MVVLDSVGGVVLCEDSVSASVVVSFKVEIGVVPEIIRVISCVTTSCGANEVGPLPSVESEKISLILKFLLLLKKLFLCFKVKSRFRLLINLQHS